MDKPLLLIIYVNFNSVDLLLKSLKSLFENTKKIEFKVIVVDNSKDDKLRAELKAFHDVIYFEEENKGFGAANNLGSEKASGRFLLFLNPDTLVVDDSISKMVEYLGNHQEVGALSPLLYNPTGQLQKHFYADNLSLLGITVKRWKGKKIDLKKPSIEVGMVSGAAMMVRRELFEKIGGFDENFFMYQEDDDLCLRFQQAGFKNVVLTGAKVIHLEGQSSVTIDKKKWYYQSQDYYFRKHFGLAATLLMKTIRFPYKLIKLISS